MQKELAVILPAFLEEENLRLLIPRIKEACTNIGINYEIIVVDTTTPMDGTESVCREHAITYLNREGKNTYGNAIRSGIKYSSARKILFMDADGSHPPHLIAELYSRSSQADICIASRYVEGGYTENPRILILLSYIVNIGYRFVLGIKCKDVSNSFKLYPGDALRKLSLKCNNFDVVEEILIKVLRQNPKFTYVEIPFTFKKRMFGKTKRDLFKFAFTYAVTLIKLRFFV